MKAKKWSIWIVDDKGNKEYYGDDFLATKEQAFKEASRRADKYEKMLMDELEAGK